MPKKLIEVALPLEAINKAAAREKSIRHGHPSTLHLWWARRPLAAARAVLFAQLVDDPSTWPELQGNEPAQKKERERLFELIETMVPWEATQEEKTIDAARLEIARSHARFRRGTAKADAVLAEGVKPAVVNEYLATELPPVHDPFAGGGTIPLEAQRLGLRAIASDLNPVAVLINKALIEIPPKFAGQPPVNPEASKVKKDWKGAEGLAEDVRYYGKWMRDEAFKRIGHLYPKAKLPKEMGGGEATVIAWLWARTVKCSNPACGAMMPLARSFVLSTKKGKEYWAEPLVDKKDKTVRFEVRTGSSPRSKGTVGRRGARCVVCEEDVALDHVRAEGKSGRMQAQMTAMVVETKKGRIYLSPTSEHQEAASKNREFWTPSSRLPTKALGFRVQNYGMQMHRDLFTSRQLFTFDALAKIQEEILNGNPGNYGLALVTYLSFAISKAIDRNSTLCAWETGMDRMRGTFARQALSMVWDYAETNPLAGAGGDIAGTAESIAEVLERLGFGIAGYVKQQSATKAPSGRLSVFSTDPPYYDNVPYADLSDFFYVWLRQLLSKIYPDLLSTMLVPKDEELVADPFRHGGASKAREFFERGLFGTFQAIQQAASIDYPVGVYYAFKQAETDADDDAETSEVPEASASTGWETMLSGLVEAGWTINGTWPMRTELSSRMRGLDSNALASSIVLVCRPRPATAPSATRTEFLRTLKRQLPRDLRLLQQGNIAPVDFAQAAIGPGMAVFSTYSQVLEADGKPMPVRTALQHINKVLDEVLSEQEGDFDADTRWALAWFEQHQYEEAQYGVAETLSKAKNTSVSGLVEAGILKSHRGNVRLLKRDELDPTWDPRTDARLTVWETTQHLIHTQSTKGETAAGKLVALLGANADKARELAYRLYSLCERKKWAQDALAYNALVTSWPELLKLAAAAPADDAPAPSPKPAAQRSLKGVS